MLSASSFSPLPLGERVRVRALNCIHSLYHPPLSPLPSRERRIGRLPLLPPSRERRKRRVPSSFLKGEEKRRRVSASPQGRRMKRKRVCYKIFNMPSLYGNQKGMFSFRYSFLKSFAQGYTPLFRSFIKSCLLAQR
mgnify:CR=1 FL=1